MWKFPSKQLQVHFVCVWMFFSFVLIKILLVYISILALNLVITTKFSQHLLSRNSAVNTLTVSYQYTYIVYVKDEL